MFLIVLVFVRDSLHYLDIYSPITKQSVEESQYLSMSTVVVYLIILSTRVAS